MQVSNKPLWDGTSPGFYEVWYFKLNQSLQGAALWCRLTLLVSRDGRKRVAEIWGIFSQAQARNTEHIAVKQTLDIRSFTYDPGQQKVQIGPCFWGHDRTQGQVESGSHCIRWDLRFTPCTRGFKHVPDLFHRLKLSKNTVSTPNPSLRFEGSFWVDGREFPCHEAAGMQGHIGGTKNALGWAWGHASLSASGEPFVFEGLSARIPLGTRRLASPLLSAFYFQYRGKEYAFRSVRDSLFSKSSYSLHHWDFIVRKPEIEFHGSIQSPGHAFAGVRYEDTDLSPLFCHNSKLAHLTLKIFVRDNLESIIESPGACAFEVVSRTPYHEVPFLI